MKLPLLAVTTSIALLAGASAFASGPVVLDEPQPVMAPELYDWSGGYVGLSFGMLQGTNNWAERGVPTGTDPSAWNGTPTGLTLGFDR